MTGRNGVSTVLNSLWTVILLKTWVRLVSPGDTPIDRLLRVSGPIYDFSENGDRLVLKRVKLLTVVLAITLLLVSWPGLCLALPGAIRHVAASCTSQQWHGRSPRRVTRRLRSLGARGVSALSGLERGLGLGRHLLEVDKNQFMTCVDEFDGF